MNKQQPEQVWLDPEGLLEVHSIFRSIQGEGPFVGMPAVFVRLAGCNITCPWCDTVYASNRDVFSVSEIAKRVQELALPGELVVLTGGEPFRQNINPLCRYLVEYGYRVQVETNGTIYRPGFCSEVTIVCSPKPHHEIDHLLSIRAAAWKYVIRSGDVNNLDGLPLHVSRPPSCAAAVFVQPMDEQDEKKNKENVAVAVNSCMKFGYRLSLQIHKIVGLP